VKIPDLEIKLTPSQMRQHMRLEMKYEALKKVKKPESLQPAPSAFVTRSRIKVEEPSNPSSAKQEMRSDSPPQK
jgi:hypothetical protein